MDTKRCHTCGEVKPLEEFYRAAGMRDGYRGECKECNRANKRARYRADPDKYIGMVQRWQRANPDRVRETRMARKQHPERKRKQRDAYYQRTYGISADEADAIVEAQGGGCAICGNLPARLASLHLDHDHDTGVIRGFLCIDCNHGLGKLRDDAALLRRAADYVEAHRQT